MRCLLFKVICDKLGAERSYGMGGQRLDGALFAVHQHRDFAYRQIGEVSEHNRGSLPFGKPSDNLANANRICWIGVCSSGLGGSLLRAPASVSTTATGVRHVERNGEEPTCRRIHALKSNPMVTGSGQRFLSKFVC
jgi:hypothetical protein